MSKSDVEKLLGLGISATSKAYQTILKKVAAGETLTPAEHKVKKSLEADLEAQQAQEKSKESANKKAHTIVSTGELCGIFQIFASQVSIWKSREGADVAAVGKNKWDSYAFLQWWLENKYDPIDPNDPDAREYRSRYEKARAEKMELQVAILKGEMKPKEDVHREWAARIAVVVNGLTIYQDRLPPLLEGKSRNQMRAIIKKENHRLREWYVKQGE